MAQDKWEYASNYVGVTTDDGVYRKVADIRVAEYAPLLGAAPELLAALEEVIQDTGAHCLSVRTIDAVMAAVDRARGVSA